MTTNNRYAQALEWAERMDRIDDLMPGHRAAVEVILSLPTLPSQIVDGAKLWKVIADWGNREITSDAYTLYRQVLALLPNPALPTLADMTPEERQACQWMQAQTWHEVGIIVWVDEVSEIAQLITRANGVLERKFKDVAPLTGEPKLKWPGNEPEETHFDDLPDEVKSVIEESIEDYRAGNFVDFDSSPRPKDVPVEEPWDVQYQDGEGTGFRNDPGTQLPWVVIGKDHHELSYCKDSDITLVSRLVPEVKP